MSRSKPESTPYHHGDLRNTLIETGAQMLAEHGAQGLSMRKLAKQAGVSHNAPYMHFADKDALLAAIAEAGFRALSLSIDEAVANAGDDWQGQFESACQAYVSFALAHPSHLQVMFSEYESDQYPALQEASSGALGRLTRLIERGQSLDVLVDGNSKQLATYVWSLLHGLSVILSNHKMPPGVLDGRTAAQLTQAYLRLALAGLRPS